MRGWWHRNQIDHVWLLFALLVLMFIIIFMNAVMARAGESCKTITVPPGAVMGNHDGDTFEVFDFNAPDRVKIRVLGVNTPEMSKRKGEPDEPGAQDAKEFTRQWLSVGEFRVMTCGTRSLDRIVGLPERNGKTLGQALIEAGLGVKAPGRL